MTMAVTAAVMAAGPLEAHKGLPPKKGETGRQEVRGRRPVGDFTLTDQEGRPLAFRDLRGKAVLVTFGFTTCVDVCPIQTAKAVAVQQALPAALRDRVHMLLITTDPAVDTPAVLKEYGRTFQADPARFSYLTGGPAALARMWRDFGVAVKRKGPGNVDHTTLTSLVDPEGNLRVNYYGLGWTPAGAVRDIANMLGGEAQREQDRSEVRPFGWSGVRREPGRTPVRNSIPHVGMALHVCPGRVPAAVFFLRGARHPA